jgi:hypothetical protein
MAPSAEVLMVAGLQLPVMPLFDVAGNAGATLFRHNGPMVLKTGVTELSMVTSMDALLAHCPASGVKVYVVTPNADVLITAGLQLPVMPSVEVVGNAGATLFKHNDPIAANVGVTLGVTVTSSVVTVAH